MSTRAAVWSEHRNDRSYLSRVPRDVIGLLDMRLSLDHRAIGGNRLVGQVHSDQTNYSHVHRRADGKILYLQVDSNRQLEIYIGTCRDPVLQLDKIQQVDYTHPQLLYVRENTLMSLDYETLESRTMGPIPVANNYVLSPTKVAYGHYPEMGIYDLITQTDTKLEQPFLPLQVLLAFMTETIGGHHYALIETHFYVWAQTQGGLMILGINLQTQKLDRQMGFTLKDSTVIDPRHVTFAERTVGIYQPNGTYSIGDLVTNQSLQQLNLSPGTRFYRRDNQYGCVIHSHSNIRQFYE